jgi:glycosyltransferase involved in cell wall biosynthesis
MEQKKIIVYMPALNEEAAIAGVLKSIPKKIYDFHTVDLLVVNDGSTDTTEKIAKQNGANVINHNYNKGLGRAFQTAIEYALKNRADILVSIDADGQFDSNQIINLIQPIIEQKSDFSIGNRFSNGKPDRMSRVKFWGNKRISEVVSIVSKTKIIDASCGFRAYSRECLLNLNLQGGFTYTHETILDLLNKNFKVAQVPVYVKYYEERVSRIAGNLFVYGYRTSIIIFKSLKDYKPLQFFLGIAFFVLFFALIIGGFVLYHWINTGMITPYKSFGFIALSLCGMSLVIATLAFIADMLNRIRENQEKILFITKKKYFDDV